MPTVWVPLDIFLNQTLNQLGFQNFVSRSVWVDAQTVVVSVVFMYKSVTVNGDAYCHTVDSKPSCSESAALWDACKKALDILKMYQSLVIEDLSFLEICMLNSTEDQLRTIQTHVDQKAEDANNKLASTVFEGNRRALSALRRIIRDADLLLTSFVVGSS
ncbi:hypothetical protein M5689_020724 [Euphorbia peplus]|nr:hypothetical protein M5689_020724 [Euphorbia peplus]